MEGGQRQRLIWKGEVAGPSTAQNKASRLFGREVEEEKSKYYKKDDLPGNKKKIAY